MDDSKKQFWYTEVALDFCGQLTIIDTLRINIYCSTYYGISSGLGTFGCKQTYSSHVWLLRPDGL